MLSNDQEISCDSGATMLLADGINSNGNETCKTNKTM